MLEILSVESAQVVTAVQPLQLLRVQMENTQIMEQALALVVLPEIIVQPMLLLQLPAQEVLMLMQQILLLVKFAQLVMTEQILLSLQLLAQIQMEVQSILMNLAQQGVQLALQDILVQILTLHRALVLMDGTHLVIKQFVFNVQLDLNVQTLTQRV